MMFSPRFPDLVSSGSFGLNGILNLSTRGGANEIENYGKRMIWSEEVKKATLYKVTP